MAQGTNGKRLATAVAGICLVAGLIIGNLWSIVRHDAEFVRADHYEREMERINDKLDRLLDYHMKQGG